MPKTREQKKEILSEISEKISKSKSIVFTKFNALGVKENEALRQELKKENSEYLVAKKTLLGIAFKENQIGGFDAKKLEGKVATIFGYEDEVMPAKIVDEFMKKHEGKMDFVGGVLEGKFLSAQEMSALAKLPSKQELYAKIVGSINAPVSGFVNVLAANLRSLVYVLKAIEEKK
jgi:large subunit ribosomal protein L10